MKKGTSFKTQILNLITESYINDDKTKVKQVLRVLKENKEIRDLYSLYDTIEKKYFDDINVAKTYVEKLSEGLCGKISIIRNSINMKMLLSEDVQSYDVENCELYSNLDVLLQEDNLRNIDEKILSKKYLVNYLTTKKEPINEEVIDNTMNENLLNSVLSVNFNTYYDTILSEEEKSELKTILSMSSEQLNENFKNLKEDVSNKVTNLINESNGELKEKLEMTKSELNSMDVSKHNYYKLTQLKNGL